MSDNSIASPISSVGCIYQIRCRETDKVYLGSAKNPKRRWLAHIGLLRNGKHHSVHLQRAFLKYGESAFVFSVVEYVEDALFLLAREQFWIWRLEGKLYNICLNAGSPLGVKHSLEARARHSLRMTGNTIRRGKKMPDEAKERVAKSLIGNQYRKGIPHSPEIKAKISAGLKKAVAEGRRSKPDPVMCAKNLAGWNAKMKQLRLAKATAEAAA